MIDSVASMASSVLIAVASAWVAVWLALRRFKTEQWWKQKAEAYSRIVECLNTAVIFCDAMIEKELGANLSASYEAEVGDAYKRAHIELKKAAGIGAFLVSEKTAAILRTLQSRAKPSDESWLEMFEADREAFASALLQVQQLARDDLQVARRSTSGPTRLAIVGSAAWIAAASALYFIGIATYPSRLTSALTRLYSWRETGRAAPGEWGYDLGVINMAPFADASLLLGFCTLPVVVAWTCFAGLPLVVRWVRAGFRNAA